MADVVFKQIDLPPYIFERMLGFSIPLNEEVAIISYEGIHVLNLSLPRKVQVDEKYPQGKDIYDERKQLLTYKGKEFRILGLHGGVPILKSSYSEELLLDIKKELLTVQTTKKHRVLEFHFKDLSGDWGFATFSDDSSHILLGIPYDIFVFERIRGIPVTAMSPDGTTKMA